MQNACKMSEVGQECCKHSTSEENLDCFHHDSNDDMVVVKRRLLRAKQNQNNDSVSRHQNGVMISANHGGNTDINDEKKQEEAYNSIDSSPRSRPGSSSISSDHLEVLLDNLIDEIEDVRRVAAASSSNVTRMFPVSNDNSILTENSEGFSDRSTGATKVLNGSREVRLRPPLRRSSGRIRLDSLTGESRHTTSINNSRVDERSNSSSNLLPSVNETPEKSNRSRKNIRDEEHPVSRQQDLASSGLPEFRNRNRFMDNTVPFPSSISNGRHIEFNEMTENGNLHDGYSSTTMYNVARRRGGGGRARPLTQILDELGYNPPLYENKIVNVVSNPRRWSSIYPSSTNNHHGLKDSQSEAKLHNHQNFLKNRKISLGDVDFNNTDTALGNHHKCFVSGVDNRTATTRKQKKALSPHNRLLLSSSISSSASNSSTASSSILSRNISDNLNDSSSDSVFFVEGGDGRRRRRMGSGDGSDEENDDYFTADSERLRRTIDNYVRRPPYNNLDKRKSTSFDQLVEQKEMGGVVLDGSTTNSNQFHRSNTSTGNDFTFFQSIKNRFHCKMNRSLSSANGFPSTGSTNRQQQNIKMFKILVLGHVKSGKSAIIQRFIDKKFDPTYRTTVGLDFRQKMLPHWSIDDYDDFLDVQGQATTTLESSAGNSMATIDENNNNADPFSTSGVLLNTKKVVRSNNNNFIRLQIWDVSGHERYSHLTGAFYKGAAGAIIVFDITDKTSFEEVVKWKEQVEKYCTVDNTRESNSSPVTSNNDEELTTSNFPKSTKSAIPVMLIANKSDLVSRRKSAKKRSNGKNLPDTNDECDEKTRGGETEAVSRRDCATGDVVDDLEIYQIVTDYKFVPCWYKTSAKSGHGIDSAIRSLVRYISSTSSNGKSPSSKKSTNNLIPNEESSSQDQRRTSLGGHDDVLRSEHQQQHVSNMSKSNDREEVEQLDEQTRRGKDTTEQGQSTWQKRKPKLIVIPDEEQGGNQQAQQLCMRERKNEEHAKKSKPRDSGDVPPTQEQFDAMRHYSKTSTPLDKESNFFQQRKNDKTGGNYVTKVERRHSRHLKENSNWHHTIHDENVVSYSMSPLTPPEVFPEVRTRKNKQKNKQQAIIEERRLSRAAVDTTKIVTSTRNKVIKLGSGSAAQRRRAAASMVPCQNCIC